ncbi:MAG: type II toxin-antitoxin system VapC family toxin [Chitinophagaceae bacterium]
MDTSSLFKLYHQETGSEEIEQIFRERKVTDIFLSDITKLEFVQAVWKKERIAEISNHIAFKLIQIFKSDFHKFTFINIDAIVIDSAQGLMAKYGKQGLRTLDSIQLASAVLMKKHAGFNSTSDKLLKHFFKEEELSH